MIDLPVGKPKASAGPLPDHRLEAWNALVPESNSPFSAVTVCSRKPSFFQITVSPQGELTAGLGSVDPLEGAADSGNLADDLTDVSFWGKILTQDFGNTRFPAGPQVIHLFLSRTEHVFDFGSFARGYINSNRDITAGQSYFSVIREESAQCAQSGL